ncbi:MAG: cytochrome c biogenesis protein CcsA [Bacteroides sp.]|nr:cytochrome c biogenesis protein CcsA [Bacteroides sp.]
MKILVWSLYVALIAVLAVATWVEYSQGTAFVCKYIYHNPTFCIGWGLLGLSALCIMYKQKMWRRFPMFLLHLSLVVILTGALTSFLSSQKGTVHLRMNESVTQFMEQETRLLKDLPFTLQLDTFYINYYPGTDAPSDYVSRVSCIHSENEASLQTEISMNKVLDFQGYRFYQSSFDEDGKGSWLSVNYDPWGTGITYVGYLMLAVSMLAVLFQRRGTFRKLLDHPLLKPGSVCLLLLLASVELHASTKKLSIISETESDSLATTQVIYHDRVVPFNTLARDFVKKLSGKDSFSGLSAEQIVGSWMKHPEEWKYVPIIKVKSQELRRRLGVEGSSYVRIVDLFEGEHYRLRELWHPDTSKTGKPSSLEKAILETDEKVALVLMLCQGTLVRQLPTDGSVEPLSDVAVQAELIYNWIPFSKILFMFNLTLGFLSFGWLLARGKWGNGWQVALLVSLLFHAVGYVLRWYIGGRIPLSNGYETMQFLALCVLVVAYLLRRRFPFVVSFGFLLSGFTLLVAYLGQLNPQITPLVPVLVSPWLSTHVSCIMIAYALLAFMWLNAVLGICVGRESERLMLFSRLLLYPAVFFLGIGIFIGAVWANVSWGRYWAWDPKEVWALITFMVYALPFHAESLSCFRRPRFFHFYMLFAFLTVLMTYFGVNYLLGGMHSYA